MFSKIRILLLLCLICTLPLRAQQYLSQITGELRDRTGAKIADTPVEVEDQETHFITKGKSNKLGLYSIPFLQPGTYTVRVHAPGFALAEKVGVILSAGDAKDASFDLAITNVSSVDVSVDTNDLETDTANESVTFNSKDVTDLPNEGRNPFNLVTLAAGVYSAIGDQQKLSASSQPFGGIASVVSSGGILNASRTTLNGIPDDPPERTVGRYTGFVPSPEAVQEVKIQTALYDAEYGHTGGVEINAVLRTGTNAYHGSAYYIFRNTYIDSNTWERTNAGLPRSNDQWNQPGGVLDGPVRIPHLYDGRNHTFFLVAYERIQDTLPEQYNPTVPSLRMRSGDFSELLDANGKCPAAPYSCIYDPLTGGTSGLRTAFPGNDLSKRLDPVGLAFLKAYPLPNAPGQGLAGLTRNYVSALTSSPDKYYSLTARVDHQINSANKVTFVYIRNRRHQLRSNEGYPGAGGPGYTHTRNNEGGSVDVVSVLSPKLVLDSRVGGVYHPFTLTYLGFNFPLTSIGFPSSLVSQLPAQTFPGVTVSDSGTALTGGASQFSGTTLLNASEILSHSIGRHSLRYGLQLEMMRYNVNTPTSGLGTFGFNRLFTQESAKAGADSQTNAGYGFASIALGYPSSGTQSTTIASAYQQLYYAGFIQDDWRVNNRLTLNLGFRWDNELPLTERHNNVDTGFCITCVSPLQVSGISALTGGLTYASSTHRYPYRRDLDNFQPRFGFAYQLNQTQVLRGGFGILYPQTIDTPGTTGYSSTTTFTTSVDGVHPYTPVSNPYPDGINQPTGSSLGLGTGLGQALAFENQQRVIPKILTTTLDLQTQLAPRLTFQVGYVGTFASNLGLSKNINALPASTFAQGVTSLQTLVTNPLAGTIPTNATLNAKTIQRRYLLLPFPQFGAITESDISSGRSKYSALRVLVNRQQSNNLQLHTSFTWAKVMRSDFLDPTNIKPTYYQDSQPNLLFQAAAVYSLPRLSSRPALERIFLGGWQSNLGVHWNTGELVANPTNVRPLGDPSIGSLQSYNHMFNTCYLTATGAPGNSSCNTFQPAFQIEPNSTYEVQTIHPFMDHVRNKIQPRIDFSVFKVFHLHESQTFEIRGEFFNVLNSVNFTAPDSTITSTTFGQVTMTQSNDPRIGQLTARFNF